MNTKEKFILFLDPDLESSDYSDLLLKTLNEHPLNKEFNINFHNLIYDKEGRYSEDANKLVIACSYFRYPVMQSTNIVSIPQDEADITRLMNYLNSKVRRQMKI